MRTELVGWALAAITAAVALTSAVVYLVTGALAQGWVVGVVIVYGGVLVAAILMMALDARAKRDPSMGQTQGEPILERRESVYQTRAGEALRLTYVWPDARREVRYTAVARGEIVTVAEIETYIDSLPPQVEPEGLDERVNAALAQKAAQPTRHPPPPSPSPTDQHAGEATPDA